MGYAMGFAFGQNSCEPIGHTMYAISCSAGCSYGGCTIARGMAYLMRGMTKLPHG